MENVLKGRNEGFLYSTKATLYQVLCSLLNLFSSLGTALLQPTNAVIRSWCLLPPHTRMPQHVQYPLLRVIQCRRRPLASRPSAIAPVMKTEFESKFPTPICVVYLRCTEGAHVNKLIFPWHLIRISNSRWSAAIFSKASLVHPCYYDA